MRDEEIPSIDPRDHPEALAKYVAAVEDPARPALRARWADPGRYTIEGSVPPDHRIAIQVNADRGWRATQDGRDIPITTDSLGFVVLHPLPAASTRIELHYWGTLEQRLMAGLCLLSWIAALYAYFRTGHA
jgi:uncharacterized membrane protein YfhO